MCITFNCYVFVYCFCFSYVNSVLASRYKNTMEMLMDFDSLVSQLYVQQCTFVEIGEGICSMFIELPIENKGSIKREMFFGNCLCSEFRQWQLCSRHLLKQRPDECMFKEDENTVNTSARVHRRLCDVTAIIGRRNCQCDCSTPLAGIQQKMFYGFKTCFANTLPATICKPRPVCGTNYCDVSLYGVLYAIKCDRNCKDHQPFCEKPGPITSKRPLVTSEWSIWQAVTSSDECNVQQYEAECLDDNGQPALDCIGPGLLCCGKDGMDCTCEVKEEDGHLKAFRYTVSLKQHTHQDHTSVRVRSASNVDTGQSNVWNRFIESARKYNSGSIFSNQEAKFQNSKMSTESNVVKLFDFTAENNIKSTSNIISDEKQHKRRKNSTESNIVRLFGFSAEIKKTTGTPNIASYKELYKKRKNFKNIKNHNENNIKKINKNSLHYGHNELKKYGKKHIRQKSYNTELPLLHLPEKNLKNTNINLHLSKYHYSPKLEYNHSLSNSNHTQGLIELNRNINSDINHKFRDRENINEEIITMNNNHYQVNNSQPYNITGVINAQSAQNKNNKYINNKNEQNTENCSTGEKKEIKYEQTTSAAANCDSSQTLMPTNEDEEKPIDSINKAKSTTMLSKNTITLDGLNYNKVSINQSQSKNNKNGQSTENCSADYKEEIKFEQTTSTIANCDSSQILMPTNEDEEKPIDSKAKSESTTILNKNTITLDSINYDKFSSKPLQSNNDKNGQKIENCSAGNKEEIKFEQTTSTVANCDPSQTLVVTNEYEKKSMDSKYKPDSTTILSKNTITLGSINYDKFSSKPLQSNNDTNGQKIENCSAGNKEEIKFEQTTSTVANCDPSQTLMVTNEYEKKSMDFKYRPESTTILSKSTITLDSINYNKFSSKALQSNNDMNGQKIENCSAGNKEEIKFEQTTSTVANCDLSQTLMVTNEYEKKSMDFKYRPESTTILSKNTITLDSLNYNKFSSKPLQSNNDMIGQKIENCSAGNNEEIKFEETTSTVANCDPSQTLMVTNEYEKKSMDFKYRPESTTILSKNTITLDSLNYNKFFSKPLQSINDENGQSSENCSAGNKEVIKFEQITSTVANCDSSRTLMATNEYEEKRIDSKNRSESTTILPKNTITLDSLNYNKFSSNQYQSNSCQSTDNFSAGHKEDIKFEETRSTVANCDSSQTLMATNEDEEEPIDSKNKPESTTILSKNTITIDSLNYNKVSSNPYQSKNNKNVMSSENVRAGNKEEIKMASNEDEEKHIDSINKSKSTTILSKNTITLDNLNYNKVSSNPSKKKNKTDFHFILEYGNGKGSACVDIKTMKEKDCLNKTGSLTNNATINSNQKNVFLNLRITTESIIYNNAGLTSSKISQKTTPLLSIMTGLPQRIELKPPKDIDYDEPEPVLKDVNGISIMEETLTDLKSITNGPENIIETNEFEMNKNEIESNNYMKSNIKSEIMSKSKTEKVDG